VRLQWSNAAFGAFLVALVAIPVVAPQFWVTLGNYIGLYSIVALGLVLLTGVAGQTSFGQAAFVGLGAYATAYLTTNYRAITPIGVELRVEASIDRVDGRKRWATGRLYEQIGRFLLREPNALLREDLPEAYRKQLRSKVQQLEMKRRWETRIGDNREAGITALRRDHTARGRITGVFDGFRNAADFGGAIGKLRALVGRRR